MVLDREGAPPLGKARRRELGLLGVRLVSSWLVMVDGGGVSYRRWISVVC